MKNMLNKAVELSAGKGRYKAHLVGILTDDELIIALLGGEKPHACIAKTEVK